MRWDRWRVKYDAWVSEGTPVSAVQAPTARWRAALRHDDYRLLFISLLPGTLGMMTVSYTHLTLPTIYSV